MSYFNDKIVNLSNELIAKFLKESFFDLFDTFFFQISL